MTEETNKKLPEELGGDFSDLLKGGEVVSEVDGKEKALTSPKQTFTTSRELARQQTRPKPTQGNLFDILTPTAKAEAIALSRADGLLSQITDGINGGTLASKVIIGLAQTLYTQSEMYGNTDRLIGISERISELSGTPISQGEAGTRRGDLTKEVKSPKPYVFLKMADFTKLVMGSRRVGGEEISRVKDIIQELDRKHVFIDRGDGKYIKLRICTIEATETDTKTGAEVMLLNLKPIFTRAIATDFVTIRKDTLRVLAGNQKDITMRLFWYLTEMHSYKTLPTYPILRISKAELYNRIAVLKQYERRKKDRETHFNEAIERMKTLHMITDYKEEQGAAGDIMCIFKLNKAYTSEPSTADRLLAAPDTSTPPPREQGNLFKDVEEEVL